MNEWRQISFISYKRTYRSINFLTDFGSCSEWTAISIITIYLTAVQQIYYTWLINICVLLHISKKKKNRMPWAPKQDASVASADIVVGAGQGVLVKS
jgi:hypothetical protein